MYKVHNCGGKSSGKLHNPVVLLVKYDPTAPKPTTLEDVLGDQNQQLIDFITQIQLEHLRNNGYVNWATAEGVVDGNRKTNPRMNIEGTDVALLFSTKTKFDPSDRSTHTVEQSPHLHNVCGVEYEGDHGKLRIIPYLENEDYLIERAGEMLSLEEAFDDKGKMIEANYILGQIAFALDSEIKRVEIDKILRKRALKGQKEIW